MKIAKNCQYCNYYKDHRCKLLDRPVSNVNTCDRWTPEMGLVLSGKNVVFVEYDDYKIEV